MKELKIILLCFLLGMYSSFVSGQTFILEGKVIADDREPLDHLGSHGGIAIHGDYALAGAHFVDELTADDDGAAYLFKWNEEACKWEQIAKIHAEIGIGIPDPDVNPNDEFGAAVSIYNKTIAIGSINYDNVPFWNCGRVYVYNITLLDEVEFSEIITPFDNDGDNDTELGAHFGRSLNLFDNMLVVGAPDQNLDDVGDNSLGDAGAAYVYNKVGGLFVFETKLVAPDREEDDQFGWSVSGFAGNIVVGARFEDETETFGTPELISAGSAYVYKLSSGWNFSQKLVAPDREEGDQFGFDVDLTQGYIVIAAPREDHDVDGLNFKNASGSAYVFELDGLSFVFKQKLVASDREELDFFGEDIAISNDRIIVGSNRNDLNAVGLDFQNSAGAAYLYDRSGPPLDPWQQVLKIISFDRAANDFFGGSVGIDGNRIFVSASSEDHEEDGFGTPVSAAGSAYIYGIEKLPEITAVNIDHPGLCSGESVTLTVDGILNDADDWFWYEGSCDGLLVGTGTSISVLPDVTTTYCVRGEGGCFDLDSSACVCVDVEIKPGNWHQSTINSQRETAKDVITDQEGNVYVTGSYLNFTEFFGGYSSNVFVTSGASDELKSYVAKYDNCGSLLWVAYAIDGSPIDSDYGTGITLDETNGFVYAVGTFKERITYKSGEGDFGAGAPTISKILAGEHGYVVRLNMSDGAIGYIDEVVLPAPTTKINAVTINENTGKIYVAGGYGLFPDYKSFVRKYSPTGSGIGIHNWEILGSSTNNEIKGIDFDESSLAAGPNGSLWFIGDYKGNLVFSIGSGSISSTVQDAYVARYRDGVIPSQDFLKKGNITGLEMTGEDISIDREYGHAYLTGHKNGGTASAFEMPSQPLPFLGGPMSYFVSMRADASPLWSSPEIATPTTSVSYSYGTGVSHHNGIVYFTGRYRNGVNFDSPSPGAILPYFGLGSDHIYVVAYDGVTGAFLWRNATLDPSTLSGRHLPSAIATDNHGHAFIVGTYFNDMGYLLGIPESADLLTTAPGGAMYAMRVDVSGVGIGELKSQPIQDDLIKEEGIQFNFNLMPNPAKDIVTVQIHGYDFHQNYQLRIFGIDGKLVHQTLINQSQFDLHLTSLERGVYFVVISDKKQTQNTLKLILE